SPKGRYLAFVRFHRGPPNAKRSSHATGSLWRVPVDKILAGVDAETLMAKVEQLTSDGKDVLLPRWHRRGIVFSARHAGSLDVGLMSGDGIVPTQKSASAQLALAKAQGDLWDRLLCLRRAISNATPRVRAEAQLLAARLFLEKEQFAKAEQLFDALRRGAVTPYARLGRLGAVMLPVWRERWRLTHGLESHWRGAARGALAQLQAWVPRGKKVASLRLLRLGDMQRLLGQTKRAIASYESLLASYPDRREEGAEAAFRLGKLFARLRTPALLARYYASIFSRYPQERDVLVQVARAIIDLYRRSPKEAQIRALRALSDETRASPLLRAKLLGRLAQLHDEGGRLRAAVSARADQVAIEAKLHVLGEAAFRLGALSLRYSAALRRQGQVGAALAFYGKALKAYEGLMKAHEPGSELYDRARREYLRLALREAAQLARQSDRGAAEKRYRRLIAFDRGVVTAHREAARLALARGVPIETIARPYRRAVDADASDFVGYYMLGFLATLRHQRPTASDLQSAEKILKAALSLRPQDPFVHMTLGWIDEMRERYLSQTGRGWLEEAILRYERARVLNDRRVDPQTEADLIVNMTNAFVALGGEAKRVGELCASHKKLGYPLRSPAQEAHHLLACARAATALGRYASASSGHSRAVELARRLSLTRLGDELLLRLALVEHLRGRPLASNRLFAQAATRLRAQGRSDVLAIVARTRAYNAIGAHRPKEALEALTRAATLLRKRGVPKIGSFSTVVPPGIDPSTAPLGFDAEAEGGVQLALREIVRQNGGDLRRALKLEKQRLFLMARRAKKGTAAERRDL
ncbi:MAG: hypothetical protein KAI47_00190, partial [Deltaproteobacteria bacterium]|nr:hypothetical protein [Deltaproteobacteria bacterium]